MKKLLILSLCLFSNWAFGARLDDVSILDVVATKDGLELKLQVKDGPKDSYFFVNVVKSDRNAFDKLTEVIKKLKKGDNYKLTLDIPSFSAFPPGSYYRREDIKFLGSDL
ncbi:MAG: hypothetical protein A3B70_07370 [Deltaproteobacteria bacterium RIFCSPHIGHO2_02_FULL_40_11]|nr:MAG: hypothetical protein A3B70_07370 [Deltaproteobacteria bacterium RIFCSPHIGHO2_02_FULL_40_11]